MLSHNSSKITYTHSQIPLANLYLALTTLRYPTLMDHCQGKYGGYKGELRELHTTTNLLQYNKPRAVQTGSQAATHYCINYSPC